MSVANFIQFFGGLAIFLFSMKFMSDGLNAVAGDEIKKFLKKITDKPYKGVIVGFIVTAITQSSSATTVMTIGLVNSKIMSFAQSIGVIMGSDIGTTLTAQLIAFKLGDLAFIFVIIGVFMLFIKQNRIMERWSIIILSFGLLFIGINFMSGSVAPLKDATEVKELIAMVDNPLLMIIAGMIITIIIQSSTAFIGIVQILVFNTVIDPVSALFLIYGSNVGTTTTGWLASISLSRTGRRVALFCTFYNLVGVTLIGTLTYVGIYEKFICWITTGDSTDPGNLMRFIANGHTFFNIISCLLFLPFTKLMEKAIMYLIQTGKEENIATGEPKHLNYDLVKTGTLAVEQAVKEMKEMLSLVKYSLEVSMDAFVSKNFRKQEKVKKIEDAIDQLQREIINYLVNVYEHSRSAEINKKIPALLHTVNDMEKLGDFAEQINEILNNQILGQKTPFYHEFVLMIMSYHNNIIYMTELTMKYLDSFDADVSYKIIELEGRINQQRTDMRKKVLEMIQAAHCDAESGINAVDYIDMIEIFGDKLKNIVKAGSHGFVYPQFERARIEVNLSGSEE